MNTNEIAPCSNDEAKNKTKEKSVPIGEFESIAEFYKVRLSVCMCI